MKVLLFHIQKEHKGLSDAYTSLFGVNISPGVGRINEIIDDF